MISLALVLKWRYDQSIPVRVPLQYGGLPITRTFVDFPGRVEISGVDRICSRQKAREHSCERVTFLARLLSSNFSVIQSKSKQLHY